MASAKISRRELQEDEIRAGLTTIGESLLARKNEIMIAGLVVVAITVGAIGWSTYSGRRNAEAQERLGRIIAASNEAALPPAERGKKMVTEGKSALEAAGSLPVANVIRYFVALGHEAAGETKEAMDTIDQVIANADAQTKGMAQFAKANMLASHGETDKASELLKEITEKGGYPKSTATLELGKVYEAAGKKDEAKASYDKVVLEFGTTPLRTEAESGLRRMGFPIPVPASPVPTAVPAAAPAKN